MDFVQPKPLLIHSKVNWRGEKKSEERKRGGRPLIAWRTPMRPSAQGLLDQAVGRRGRPIGRALGMSGQSDGRARNPFYSSGRAPGCVERDRAGRSPDRAATGRFSPSRPIGSLSPRADGPNAVGFLGRDRRIGQHHL